MSPQSVFLFDLDTPILLLPFQTEQGHTAVAHWTLREACEGTQIFGTTGSGQTSGSGQATARAFLTHGFGGLVLCAKVDERETWGRYAQEKRPKLERRSRAESGIRSGNGTSGESTEGKWRVRRQSHIHARRRTEPIACSEPQGLRRSFRPRQRPSSLFLTIRERESSPQSSHQNWSCLTISAIRNFREIWRSTRDCPARSRARNPERVFLHRPLLL